MMKEEFEKLAGIEVTCGEYYQDIEPAYLESEEVNKTNWVMRWTRKDKSAFFDRRKLRLEMLERDHARLQQQLIEAEQRAAKYKEKLFNIAMVLN